ncbi:MAG TPA: hypothetical protein VII92_11810 [Anaerolineae bacterium]
MPNYRKLVISLDGAERTALAMLAERERRDLRSQAALLIRQSLIGAGLLDTEPILPTPAHTIEVAERDARP